MSESSESYKKHGAELVPSDRKALLVGRTDLKLVPLGVVEWHIEVVVKVEVKDDVCAL